MCFIYSQIQATIPTDHLKHLYRVRKRSLLPISTPAASSPWQPLTSFLSLWICLFCILHTNGILQLRPFVSVACIGPSLPPMAGNTPLCGETTLHLSIYPWGDMGVVSTLGLSSCFFLTTSPDFLHLHHSMLVITLFVNRAPTRSLPASHAQVGNRVLLEPRPHAWPTPDE